MSRRLTGESVAVYLEAREILTLIGPDHDADQHWTDLGKEIGAVCRIDGCEADSCALRLCSMHYKRHQRATTEAHTVNRAKTGRPARLHIDDLAWVIDCNRSTVTADELAHRFGVTRGGIRKALERNERHDLLAILARNAERAA